MAKKKKSANPAASVMAEPATAVKSEADVGGDANSDNDNSNNSNEEETTLELLQVDVGDIMKVKQVLDEAVAGTFSEVLGLPEDHYLDNVKLGVMTTACAFAVVAQFSPAPFPESRPMLFACCACYFILSGVLQAIVYFLDRDAVVTTRALEKTDARCAKNARLAEHGLRVRTSLPRFEEFFSVVLEFEKLPDTPFVKKTWSVGKFFDVEGTFDEIGVMEEVEALFHRFANSDFDVDDDVAKKTN